MPTCSRCWPTPPHPKTELAVAARPGLSPIVADAIAGHASAPAIQVLLANPSAQIRRIDTGCVGRPCRRARALARFARSPAQTQRPGRARARHVRGRAAARDPGATKRPRPGYEAKRRDPVASGLNRNPEPPDDAAMVADALRLKGAKVLDEIGPAEGGARRRAAPGCRDPRRRQRNPALDHRSRRRSSQRQGARQPGLAGRLLDARGNRAAIHAGPARAVEHPGAEPGRAAFRSRRRRWGGRSNCSKTPPGARL